MRRIALYSDIHANLPALERVLADIEAAEVDEAYCLGDLVGYGPHPNEVVERVVATGHPVVRGNYDDGIGFKKGNCGCFYPTPEDAKNGAASYTFTNKVITDENRALLTEFADDIVMDVEGIRVTLCHGSPRKINEYLLLDRPDDFLVRLAEEADTDVVCLGHVHIPYHRVVKGPWGPVHYVSDGSVGKPKGGDTRANWTEVVIGTRDEVRALVKADSAAGSVGASETWLGTRMHRLDYDVASVVEDMRNAGLPDALGDALRSE